MQQRAGKPPKMGYETVANMFSKAKAGHLDALVRKKMGDGTHNVGTDIWEVQGYSKKSLEDFIVHGVLDEEKYVPQSEDTFHHLDSYFE